MKYIIFSVLFISFAIVSCKQENIEPSQNQETSQSSVRINKCKVNELITHGLLAGNKCIPKKWLVQYYDTLGNRMDLAPLISPIQDNVFYWQPNDSLIEYSYIGFVMDKGVYKIQDCGKTALINTTLSGGDNKFTLEIVRYNYLQGYFWIPAGPQGQLVFSRVKFYLSN